MFHWYLELNVTQSRGADSNRRSKAEIDEEAFLMASLRFSWVVIFLEMCGSIGARSSLPSAVAPYCYDFLLIK